MKLTLTIIERNGEIDTETTDRPIDEGFAVAGRFLNIFHDDPYRRIASVSVDGQTIATFDSITGKLTI